MTRIATTLLLVCLFSFAAEPGSELKDKDKNLLNKLSGYIEELEIAPNESKVLSLTNEKGDRTGVAIANDGENIVVLFRKTTIVKLEKEASERKTSNDPITKKIDEASDEMAKHAKKIYLELIVKELQWQIGQYSN
jgi:hypothetical protein